MLTGVNYPGPDRINPVDEREYGRIFENWLPFWREAGIVPAVFEYNGNFPDETGRMDHQRYIHIHAQQLREDEGAGMQRAASGWRFSAVSTGSGPTPSPILPGPIRSGATSRWPPCAVATTRRWAARMAASSPMLSMAYRSRSRPQMPFPSRRWAISTTCCACCRRLAGAALRDWAGYIASAARPGISCWPATRRPRGHGDPKSASSSRRARNRSDRTCSLNEHPPRESRPRKAAPRREGLCPVRQSLPTKLATNDAMPYTATGGPMAASGVTECLTAYRTGC